MTVIEADAVNTLPHAVDSIQIYAGQRYSFVFHANQTVDNYWIRALPNLGHRSFEGGINSAILRYKGAPESEPISSNPPVSVKPLVEAALRPLDPRPAVRIHSSAGLRNPHSHRDHPAWNCRDHGCGSGSELVHHLRE